MEKKKYQIIDSPKIGKINKFMNIYNYDYAIADKKIKWPIDVFYGGNKYYLMNKKTDLINPKSKILNYYCSKHRYNSKIKNKCKVCDSKIQYIRNEDEFYLIHDHSAECQYKKAPSIKEIKVNSNNYYKLSNLKNDLISYLNKNPLKNYKDFKNYAEEELIKLNLNIYNNDNFYKNIFYPWKKNNLCFKWYSVYENNKTKINKIYLREVLYTYIYLKSLNTPILHHHIIWVSPFFIKQLQNELHFYIDGTFVHPVEFKELLIILFYDITTASRYPGSYILLNSKNTQGYFFSIK